MRCVIVTAGRYDARPCADLCLALRQRKPGALFGVRRYRFASVMVSMLRLSAAWSRGTQRRRRGAQGAPKRGSASLLRSSTTGEAHP
jgi:hypothetical protein